MESDGGGVTAAAAITPWRLVSQPSTLREFFLTNDLRDTLKTVNNNNHNHNPSNQRPKSRLTLGAVLNSDQKRPRTSKSAFFRTLLEAVKAEALRHKPSKKSWKPFKSQDKLKQPKLPHFSYQNQNQNLNTQYFARSSLVRKSNWTFSSRRSLTSTNLEAVMKSSYKSNSLRGVETVPADDLTLREITSGGSPRSGGSFRLSAAVAAEREETRRRLSRELVEGSMDEKKVEPTADGNEEDEEEDEEEQPDSGTGGGQPMRMSLMDLLEETDRQAGISGPTYRLDDEELDYEEEEEEEEEEEHDTGKGEEYSCCVCNVKHRASAFKGCGHTFCRLCSRELDVQKGYCPQCNGFLLEVLDIF